jgi:hypothetical protein
MEDGREVAVCASDHKVISEGLTVAVQKQLGIAIVVGALALTAIPQTSHAQAAVASVAGVSFKLVEPSTISPWVGPGDYGDFEISVSQTVPYSDCSWDLARYNDFFGPVDVADKVAPGSSVVDLAWPARWLQTVYYITPYDCSGNAGATVTSATFSPATVNDPFRSIVGSSTVVKSKKYYFGDALETTVRNDEVEWNTDDVYNLGVVVGTGPQGGIGTVYVDGVAKGTINFYSTKIAGRRLLFKYGTGTAAAHTIVIIATGKGSTGGFDMFLDAAVEIMAN